jgi:PPOX class probable F420-dependent enzyme
MDRDAAWARVRSARVGRMATVTPEHRPHVVPFVFVLVERGSERIAYWAVDHKPKRSSDLKRIRNLGSNPAVEFVVDGYDEDWERLWWVRCSGAARSIVEEDEHTSAMHALREKYPQYAIDPPSGTVVAIDIESIESWVGSGPKDPSSTAS